MSLLERTRNIVPSPHVSRSGPVATAAGFGAVGALALALILVIPVLVAWAADPHSTVSWTDALSFAPAVWVLAHHGSLGIPANHLTVYAPPLMITVAAVFLARMAAASFLPSLAAAPGAVRWPATLVPATDSDADAAAPGRSWWHVPAAFVGGYTGTGVLLSLLTWIGPTHPNPLMVIPGSVLVAALGLAWALRRDHRSEDGEDIAAPLAAWLAERTPRVLAKALRPALQGAGVLLALGLLLVVAAVALSWGRVHTVGAGLGAGAVGTVLMTLGQLLVAPNIAAFGATWLSGSSLQIGSVTVGHAVISPGVLPMIPVLGALPEAGAGPWWAPFVPLLPVAVGGFVGYRSLRHVTSLASLRTKLQNAALAAGLAGVLVLAIAYVAALGLRGGSLGYVGPSLMAVPSLLVELVVGATATAGALHYWRTRR